MTSRRAFATKTQDKHTWTPDRLRPRAKRARRVTFLLLESKERWSTQKMLAFPNTPNYGQKESQIIGRSNFDVKI
ncbi:Sulfhydryl oxidase [Psidium guajava]|nr:Sulfhydryl oxidase [Psidium guajava]